MNITCKEELHELNANDWYVCHTELYLLYSLGM